MTGAVPLILSQEPISKGLMARAKEPGPNVAVVYADGDGHITSADGRPLRRGELAASQYRVQYEVDLRDHRRTARLDSSPLPSSRDTYFFQSVVDVGFRVTDPAAVVRCNVTDGLTVVYGYLVNAFRRITRSFDIGEAAEAEDAINIRYRQSVTLEEGITIYHCRARLSPDEAGIIYLRSLEEANRPVLSPAAAPAGPPIQGGPVAGVQAPAVVPVYLIIDESAADEAYFQALDDGLQELLAGLAGQPEVLAAVRLAVLGYADDVAARMPVNAVTADTMLPQLTPRPGASLAAVFAYLHSYIPRDMEWLKSRHPAVIRPTAYLLCATAPDNGPEWETGLAQILDKTAFRYAPNIVACGVAAMPARALAAIAVRPGCYVFAADPGLPLGDAVRHYTSFVQREIAAQVHAQISGKSEVSITPPERFHALWEFS